MNANEWDATVLDELVALADAHASTDLIITHRGETIVEFVGEIDEARRAAVSDVLDDGRAIQDTASSQKSVVSVLVGIAVAKGLLDTTTPVRHWLGDEWDADVTVHHLLSMTSGLNEDLSRVEPTGSWWDYNLGAAYHSIKLVLARAADASLNEVTADWLLQPLGMHESEWRDRVWSDAIPAFFKTSFVQPDGSPVEAFHTSGRDLSTFAGAVCAALRGDTSLGIDPDYLSRMVQPSSALNPAYGLYWWVNTGTWGLAPKSPHRIDGPWFPGSPDDAVFALGNGDRMAAIVPSLDLTIVRLGAPADTPSAAGSAFLRTLSSTVCAACPA